MTADSGSSAPAQFDLRLAGRALEAGAHLPSVHVRGWWWGPESDLAAFAAAGITLTAPPSGAPRVVARAQIEQPASTPSRAAPFDLRVPTVLVVHALTGDSRVGGDGGWWEPVCGPGRPLDPTRLRLLCFNNLGGCYGTTGPAAPEFPRRSDDSAFAPSTYCGRGAFAVDESALPATVTTWDQARLLLDALDALGLPSIHLCAGGSIGGMIALCVAAHGGARVQRLLPIAACARASPWIIAWNHVGRQAIVSDPEWPRAAPAGLRLARELAHITYRAEPGLIERQGRALAGASPDSGAWSSRTPYAVQTYLEHQGARLVDRFHPGAYVAQLDAMDHHDLGRLPPWISPLHGSATSGADRIRASTLAVSIDSDQLYLPAHSRALAASLRGHGLPAEAAEIRSPHGHDAFLIEWEQVGALLRRALSLQPPTLVSDPPSP